MLHRAKLTPASDRAAVNDAKLGDSPAQTEAIPNRTTPAIIVRLRPSRVTRTPAGTSKIIVPMWRAEITNPTIATVAPNSLLANPGRTGISIPCPTESKNDGAYTDQTGDLMVAFTDALRSGGFCDSGSDIMINRIVAKSASIRARRVN